ncbi:uncharacterized protein LOC131846842 [Achroia grisella]|uniref:uncharacterized protein LOC131846842 n=1 Tax=Achroia grisella TaxID=688607 RepID=UPI0027D28F76|nr:uncharacterized protein LOC131846842 [Achroia grisella]
MEFCILIMQWPPRLRPADTVRSFKKSWEMYRKSYESALNLMLRENYGNKGMNVFVRKMKDNKLLSNGFFFSDGSVDVVLEDLYLLELPKVIVAETTLSLDSNILHVEMMLSQMIVEATYILFRNESAIVYAGRKNLNVSPFALQQVHRTGELVLTVEGCVLSGLVIATLMGQSVNLGYESLKLNECRFNVEISSTGLGAPPVISTYFSKEQVYQLGNLIMKPLREELMPKLQGAMFTYINTTSVFQTNLPKFRYAQENVLKQTHEYIRGVVNKLSKLTVEDGVDSLQINDLKYNWNELRNRKQYTTHLLLTNVTLAGLETLYSAQIGGPYRFDSMRIDEMLRYHSLQVRGKLYIHSEADNGQQDFAAELLDVGVRVTINVDVKKVRPKEKKMVQTLVTSKAVHKFEIVGWRDMELNHVNRNSVASRALITGYLVNEIPKCVIKHFSRIFKKAIGETRNKKRKPNTKPTSAGKIRQYENSDRLIKINEIKSDNETRDEDQSSKEESAVDISNKKYDFFSSELFSNSLLKKPYFTDSLIQPEKTNGDASKHEDKLTSSDANQKDNNAEEDKNFNEFSSNNRDYQKYENDTTISVEQNDEEEPNKKVKSFNDDQENNRHGSDIEDNNDKVNSKKHRQKNIFSGIMFRESFFGNDQYLPSGLDNDSNIEMSNLGRKNQNNKYTVSRRNKKIITKKRNHKFRNIYMSSNKIR